MIANLNIVTGGEYQILFSVVMEPNWPQWELDILYVWHIIHTIVFGEEVAVGKFQSNKNYFKFMKDMRNKCAWIDWFIY